MQCSMVPPDVLVDAVGERLVVGVAGEVAVFEHPQPGIGLLGRGDEILGKGFLERRPRAAAFVSLSFEVELEAVLACLGMVFRGEGVCDALAAHWRDAALEGAIL